MKRVLLTGGTGFIGRPTLAALADRGWEVHLLSRRSVSEAPADGVVVHPADLFDERAVASAVERAAATHLVHLAWYVEPGQVWSAPENVAWVDASLSLLRGFAAAGGRRAVLAGSVSEYGNPPPGGICREAEEPAPDNLYGESKARLGELALGASADLGLSTAWPRIFFVFGPHEHPVRLVSSVAIHLLRGEPAPCSHGRQVRDYMHTAEIADAVASLLESELEGAVNVGSGQGVSLRELVGRVARAAGRPELVEFGAIEPGPNQAPTIVADVSRLRDELGWSPGADLDSRVDETVAWWRSRLG